MSEYAHKQQVKLSSEGDVVTVRKVVRAAAIELGFGVTDITRIVTAASELARNVYRFAGVGVMTLESKLNSGRKGIILTFTDNGPGIEDIETAMNVGYTTGGGLGLGLPGAKRLMDEMVLESKPGHGTKVRVVKWLT
jgi:serine/threonine-protein kinase RsbT